MSGSQAPAVEAEADHPGARLADAGELDAAVRRVCAESGGALDPARAHAAAVAELDAYGRRHPDSPALDRFQLTRLATYAADPMGEGWQEQAGLLGTDSCGYPVAGGMFDVRSDMAASPLAVGHPGATELALAALRVSWADDYIQTGSARLDRGWQEPLSVALAAEQGTAAI